MGKVIILAGAPDAVSLDWSALEPGMQAEATRWEDGIDTDAHGSSHPQWRVVPPRGVGREAQAAPRQGTHLAVAIDQTGGVTTRARQVARGHHRLLYGCAESVTLTPASRAASTQRLSNPSQDQQNSGPVLSSLDEASLSLRLPNALPLPLPASLRDEGNTTTTSQEFLEHSLAVHDALPSSLPVDLSEVHGAAASFDETTTTTSSSLSLSLSPTTSLGNSLFSTLPPLPANIPPRWQPLTHLADVPSAAYLLSLAPQTVTVNLVVAVVSVGAPRAVNSNRNNNNNHRHRPPASLVELVVGDETRSGFRLTIWIDGSTAAGAATTTSASASSSTLAALLPTLAPHDVVLLRHVALHVFGDKAYGSSLRKDQTKMHILHRGQRRQRRQQQRQGSQEDEDDALFSAAHLAAAASIQAASPAADWQLLAKAARVRDWALRYVVVDGVGVSVGNDGTSLVEDDGGGPRQTTTRQTWMLPPAYTQ